MPCYYAFRGLVTLTEGYKIFQMLQHNDENLLGFEWQPSKCIFKCQNFLYMCVCMCACRVKRLLKQILKWFLYNFFSAFYSFVKKKKKKNWHINSNIEENKTNRHPNIVLSAAHSIFLLPISFLNIFGRSFSIDVTKFQFTPFRYFFWGGFFLLN